MWNRGFLREISTLPVQFNPILGRYINQNTSEQDFFALNCSLQALVSIYLSLPWSITKITPPWTELVVQISITSLYISKPYTDRVAPRFPRVKTVSIIIKSLKGLESGCGWFLPWWMVRVPTSITGARTGFGWRMRRVGFFRVGCTGVRNALNNLALDKGVRPAIIYIGNAWSLVRWRLVKRYTRGPDNR